MTSLNTDAHLERMQKVTDNMYIRNSVYEIVMKYDCYDINLRLS